MKKKTIPRTQPPQRKPAPPPSTAPKLTEDELRRLGRCMNRQEWDAVYADIKAVRNGEQPSDWVDVVVIGGLKIRTSSVWME